ncbi:MAG: hypothetical protein LUC26_08100 [Prevotella sp.]|nr:hypothetical protein [Prevotella sp.]
MKKILISTIVALGLLASCDPATDDISAPKGNITSEQLAAGFVTVQYADADYTTPQEDGNYFTFTTSPACMVEIYQINEDGSETQLGYGTSGTFKLAPKRGSDTTQTVWLRTLNYDATEVVASKTYTVYVSGELTQEVRYLASDDYGSKTWKWDTDWREDQGSWGNAGYSAGSGDGGWESGIWWACYPDDLTGQLNHAADNYGESYASVDCYMVFDEDGTIKRYDANGNAIGSNTARYTVTDYTGEFHITSADNAADNFALGYLDTDGSSDGGILWPYVINAGGAYANHFEIVKLDAGHLRLVYPYSSDGTAGNWAECTWWAFKSTSDAVASLTDFGTKAWTWDTDWRDDQGAWGNAGYSAGSGDGGWTSGIWWACAPADLVGQLNHTGDAPATGEESVDAYMTFDWNTNTVTSYDADGKELRSAGYEITDWGGGEYTITSADNAAEGYAMGYLETSGAGILFPWVINAGGVNATHFEIVKLTTDQLQLVYPYSSDGSAGNWAECTWWAFKAK